MTVIKSALAVPMLREYHIKPIDSRYDIAKSSSRAVTVLVVTTIALMATWGISHRPPSDTRYSGCWCDCRVGTAWIGLRLFDGKVLAWRYSKSNSRPWAIVREAQWGWFGYMHAFGSCLIEGRIGVPWGANHQTGAACYEAIGLWAPIWPALLLAVPLSAFALRVRRQERRRRYDQCLRYGYDLAYNVSGVWSECGVKTRSEAVSRAWIEETVS